MELSSTEIIFIVLSILFSFVGSVLENSKLYFMTVGNYKVASVLSPLDLLFVTLSGSFAVAFSSVSGLWWFILAYALLCALMSFTATMISKKISEKVNKIEVVR